MREPLRSSIAALGRGAGCLTLCVVRAAPPLFAGRGASGVARGLADFLWPPRCWVCGEGFGARHTDAAGEPFGPAGACEAHALDVGLIGARCGVCAAPLPEGVRDGARCGPCRRGGRRFRRTVAAVDYADASARDWLLRFKHGGRADLAIPLGRLLGAALEARGVALGPNDLLVPVPLHPARRVERGYDQAHLLAREVARATPATLAPMLRRVRATDPQGAPAAAARGKNVRGAFVCRAPRLPPRARVWLVDDVLTSGATADACAEVLKQRGAAAVDLLVVARAAATPDGADPAP